jgi:hypothetical protein
MKNVCLDFDGVMNTYDGWAGDHELFQPRPGLEAFLQGLTDADFRVYVHSTRPKKKVVAWLADHGLASLVEAVVSEKPVAVAYVDDRAVRFDGDFEATLRAVTGFRAYWEPPAEKQTEAA